MKISTPLKLSFVLGFCGVMTGLQAQESVNSNGGDASGNGGSVSFSIGQIVYTTHRGINGSELQGVIQPYEISMVTAVREINENIFDFNLDCAVYPNPTSNKLTLKIEGNELNHLYYKLFDISGKLIENKRIEDNLTLIFMDNLLPSTYLLKIFQNKNEVKTFKIIKNQ